MIALRTFAALRKEHSFPKQRLTVNSLGEVFRIDEQNKDGMSIDDSHYLAGNICLSDMARTLGHEPSEEEIQIEFDMQLKEFCNPEEFVFAKRVWDLQKANDSRFRVWGFISVDGSRFIWLVTEFRALVIDKPMWRETIDTARRLSGGVRNICKAPQLDHMIKNYGKPDEEHVYGPDHGKMERQVEMYWNVAEWTESQIIAQREEFVVRTQKLWDTYGIGVI